MEFIKVGDLLELIQLFLFLLEDKKKRFVYGGRGGSGTNTNILKQNFVKLATIIGVIRYI